MNVWVAMVLAGAGTYALRSSMILARDRFGELAWLESRLPLVGPAAIAAIVATAMFTERGARVIPHGLEVAAVAVGFLAVRRTGSVGAALAAGLPVYWAGAALGMA